MNGRNEYQGGYDSKEVALAAYNKGAMIHFKEYARLNEVADYKGLEEIEKVRKERIPGLNYDARGSGAWQVNIKGKYFGRYKDKAVALDVLNNYLKDLNECSSRIESGQNDGLLETK